MFSSIKEQAGGFIKNLHPSERFHEIVHNLHQERQPQPKNKDELIEEFRRSQKSGRIGADVLRMLEGSLSVADLCVSDMMVPRSQIEFVDLAEPNEVWIPKMIARGHSRFPVVEGDLDNVKGILHAKDLLRLITDPKYDVRAHLRPARFVPEMQPLNLLLRDFRDTRNHMAIVVDEFGSISGLITIEDVIELIVGDIDDEFDNVNADKDNIQQVDVAHWKVKSETSLDQFNEYFAVNIEDDYCETIGGVVTDRFEHVPHKGETIELDGFRFKVTKGDARQATLFNVERLIAATPVEGTATPPAEIESKE
jgi:magnesium and cobalt transporter